MRYYIGCTGWKDHRWVKSFYPTELDSKYYLSYYSNYFNLVHIDFINGLYPSNSFTLKKWVMETPSNFRFTLKIPQSIINIASTNKIDILQRFLEQLIAMKEKILAILISPPPYISLKNNGREWLENILNNCTRYGFSVVLDFGTYNSWYQELTYNILRKYKSSFSWSNSEHLSYYPAITSNFIFLNLKNTYNNSNEIKRWIDLIKQKVDEYEYSKYKDEILDCSIIISNNPSNASIIQDLIFPQNRNSISTADLQTSSKTQLWSGKIIMHIDMNAFFPACEEIRDSSLKGKAHAVIMTPEKKGGIISRGAVASCSYEARKYGVRSAMSLSKAKELCPDLIVRPVDKEYYNLISQQVMRLLEEYADILEQTSIDEAYIDCTQKIKLQQKKVTEQTPLDHKEKRNMPNYAAKYNPQIDFPIEEFALKIKNSIREQCNGLVCSIGVAPNKSIAKIASDFKKPDGLTIVYPQNIKEFLSDLAVDRISGIGIKTANTLKDMRIETIGQMSNLNIQKLIEKFGKKQGLWMWYVANGKESEDVTPREDNLSLSTEETLLNPTTNKNDILCILVNNMSNDIYERIKRKGYEFKTVGIKLVRTNFSVETREVTFPSHQRSKESILSVMETLLDRFNFDISSKDNNNENNSIITKKDHPSIRKIGIKVSNLSKIDINGNNPQRSILDFI